MAARVAIVGGGPGGMSCAVLLAASGLDVTVFEARPVLGGRTARIELTGDDDKTYAFDRGPTFFLMPYVLEEIFAAAGRDLHDYATLTRLDPMYRLILGRENDTPITLDCTQDLSEMSRRLSAISPTDAANFQRFIADNREKLRLMEPILRRPIRSLFDLADFETAKVLPHLNPHLSVHGLLSRYFKHPLVQRAVSFQSKYLGMSPRDCPSIFTILPFIEYEYGIWHPTGGCNALIDAMARVFEELGGMIRLGSPVERVTFNGQQATGVVVDGETLAYDHIVINADAPWAIKNLIPASVRPASISNAAIDRKKYSCSTFMLYLGLDGEIDLPHHTIYVTGKYEDNLADITDRGVLSDEPSMYICNPSAMDPSLAPAGQSAAYVLVPTPNCKIGEAGGIDWSRESQGLRATTIEQMERVFGIPSVESRIRAELMLTPDDWRASNIQFGATFNLAHGLMQMLHRRPRNELNGLKNCWLVGGGTHPGSGLPVIFLSSQTTARLLCARAGVPCAADRPGTLAEPAAV